MGSTRRVLIISATTGYQLRSFNEAASRLGAELTFATDRCHTLEDPWRDDAIAVRFHEESASVAAIAAYACERPFAGVIAVGDRPTTLAADAAAALGLPWHTAGGTRSAVSKLASRQCFARAGLRTPWFRLVAEEEAAGSVVQDPSIGFPCVVKPTGLSGSRGVIRADSPDECALAIIRVRALLGRREIRMLRHSEPQRLLIEGFIPGREHAVEGLLSAGRLQLLAIFDKPDPLDGPFFEETIYVAPSSASHAVQLAIERSVERAALALGLWHGPIHAECRVGDHGVVMLEVAARPIGGLCSKVLRFEREGRPTVRACLEELLLRHALGEDVRSWRRVQEGAAVMMIPIPMSGRLRRVDGESDARAVEAVEEVTITAKRDQLLEPLPEAGSYLGFIFARAASAGAAESALREAHRRLTFVIDAPISVASG